MGDFSQRVSLQLVRDLCGHGDSQLRVAEPHGVDGRFRRTRQQSQRCLTGPDEASNRGPQQVEERALPGGEHKGARWGPAVD